MVCPRHPGKGAMAHYAAFDMSDKETAIHELGEHGKLVRESELASELEVLATTLWRHARELQRVDLETGQLVAWRYQSLRTLGVPVACLDDPTRPGGHGAAAEQDRRA